jgi:hypothetical protein
VDTTLTENAGFNKLKRLAKYSVTGPLSSPCILALHDPLKTHKHEYYVFIFSMTLSTEEHEYELISIIDNVFKGKVVNPHRTAVFLTSREYTENLENDLKTDDFFRIGFKWDNDDKLVKEIQIFTSQEKGKQ